MEGKYPLRLPLITLLLLLMTLFIIQNIRVVEVHFLFWTVQASRAVIYLSIFAIGALSGWLGNTLHRWHKRR